jgi:hypothetical protein
MRRHAECERFKEAAAEKLNWLAMDAKIKAFLGDEE